MKKYIFAAYKKQLEKPTEPLHVFAQSTKCSVLAENEQEAYKLAEKKMAEINNYGGIVLGKVKLIATAELPVDWNYGYGDERKEGTCCDKKELCKKYVIR